MQGDYVSKLAKRYLLLSAYFGRLYIHQSYWYVFDGLHSGILENKLDVEIVFKPYHYSKICEIGEVFKDHFYNGVIVVGASDTDMDYINKENTLMPVVF